MLIALVHRAFVWLSIVDYYLLLLLLLATYGSYRHSFSAGVFRELAFFCVFLG